MYKKQVYNNGSVKEVILVYFTNDSKYFLSTSKYSEFNILRIINDSSSNNKTFEITKCEIVEFAKLKLKIKY